MIPWYYLTIISAILMGIASVQEKKALKKEYASAYSSDFSVIAAIASLFLIPFASFNINLVQVGWVYLLSIATTAGYLLAARAYRHGELSVTSSIYNSLPILFIVILGFLLLGETLTPIQYGSIGVAIIGIILLLFFNYEETRNASVRRRYLRIILLSSFVSAIGAILLKYIVSDISVNPITTLILTQVFSALNFTIYMQLKYGGVKEMFRNLEKYRGIIVTQAIFTTAYRATFYVAAALAAISLVSPLRNTIYVIITIFAGGTMFREKNIKLKMVIAAVLIITSYLLIV